MLFFSCNSNENTTEQDVATKGEISIQSDEAFEPIIKAQEFTFESLYPQAKLNISYVSEGSLIRSFLDGKVETILSGRKLNTEEINFVKSKGFSVQQTRIATDAILVVVNPSYLDSAISVAQIKDLLQGKIKKLNELNPNMPSEPVSLVFDKSNSSNIVYMESFFGARADSAKIFATGNNIKILEFVRNNSNAIGFLGWCWVSDEDDTKVQNHLKGIKVLKIENNGKMIPPDVEYVIDSLYPFSRGIYIINKGARAGLGTGFASFMASDRGQRIVLKSGIVPSTVPGREIELK